MRKQLEQLDGVRQSFTGVFDRYGTKPNWHGFPEKTVLLRDIRNATGQIVTDHLWFNLTKQFEGLGELTQGDLIRFDGRVRSYVKGYVNYHRGVDERELDYRLSHPTRVSRYESAQT